RAAGAQTHLARAGTPNTAGIRTVSSLVGPSTRWGNLHQRPLGLALLATVWLGGIGFLDDYLRVVKGYPKGLLGRYKLAGQVALGLAIGWILLRWPEPGLRPSVTHVPFLKFRYMDFGVLFILFVIFMVTASSNAVNLTDGL